MDILTDREKRDIEKIAGNKDYFYFLSEHRKTAAVSLAAVSDCGQNLEYVPEEVINKDICRAAIGAKDADCSILSYIPFPEVQKEGIQLFSGNTPAFVLYSLVDIQDAKMAQEAVCANAYCLQLVPNELITIDLCKQALQNPEADKTVLGFIPERFHNNPEIRKMAEERFGEKSAQKDISSPVKKKGVSIY